MWSLPSSPSPRPRAPSPSDPHRRLQIAGVGRGSVGQESAGEASAIDISIRNTLHSHENKSDMPHSNAHEFYDERFDDTEFDQSEHKDSPVHINSQVSMKSETGDCGISCDIDNAKFVSKLFGSVDFESELGVGSHKHGMQSQEIHGRARKEVEVHDRVVNDEEVIDCDIFSSHDVHE